MKISLCLLTLNEIHGCKADVPLLPLDQFDEVYTIDGGSKDGTCEYLSDMGIKVFQQDEPGYNNAYISAFRRCTTDAVVLFHPKGSIEPDVVRQFRTYLEDEYELVIASRMAKGAVNEEDQQFFKPRKWFVLGLALMAKLAWQREGNTVWDVLHGLRAVKKEAFSRIAPLDKGLSIDLELVARAYKLKLKRVEFPVVERPRLHGSTHFNAFSTGRALLRYFIFELLRRE